MEKERLMSDQNLKRKEECETLRQFGEVIGAIAASRNLLKGTPTEAALDTKEEVIEQFSSPTSSRRNLIEVALDVQETCIGLRSQIRQGCDETEIAFQIRKQNLIVLIVEAGIAKGPMAVDVVDYLMGRANLNLDGMAIVKQVQLERSMAKSHLYL